jgi:hypothetical protein
MLWVHNAFFSCRRCWCACTMRIRANLFVRIASRGCLWPTKGTDMDICKWYGKTCTSGYDWLTGLLKCCYSMRNGNRNCCPWSMILLLGNTAGTPHCSAATTVTRLQSGRFENRNLIPGGGRYEYLLLQQHVHAIFGTRRASCSGGTTV